MEEIKDRDFWALAGEFVEENLDEKELVSKIYEFCETHGIDNANDLQLFFFMLGERVTLPFIIPKIKLLNKANGRK
jgi:hypothetical protein